MAPEHPQLSSLHEALSNLESLRDAAIFNGPQEQKLAAYLRAACKCVELALMEAKAVETCAVSRPTTRKATGTRAGRRSSIRNRGGRATA
jgi:hypothetical protein